MLRSSLAPILFAAALATAPTAQCLDHELFAVDVGTHWWVHDLAFSADRVVIGTPHAASAHFLAREESGWVVDSVIHLSDEFGDIVDVEGDTAVVGGRNLTRVYELVDGTWTMTFQLLGGGDFAKIYGDRIVVGGITFTGSTERTWVLKRTAGTWAVEAELLPPTFNNLDTWGGYADLRGDWLVVEAEYDTFVERCHVYHFDGTNWSEHADFGIARSGPVRFVGDDRIACAAAWAGSDLALYGRDPGGTLWTALDSLVIGPGSVEEGQLAVTGEAIYVGLPTADLPGFQDMGVVHRYRVLDDLLWRDALVRPKFEDHEPHFGQRIDVNGNRLDVISSQNAFFWAMTSFDLYGMDADDPRPSLAVDVSQVSLSTGGSVTLSVDACEAWANNLYWIVGSASGTSPVTPIASQIALPLVADAYLNHTLANPGVAPLTNGAGLLDVDSHGEAIFTLPPGLPPALAGVTLHHASLVAGTTIHSVTGAVAIRLVP